RPFDGATNLETLQAAIHRAAEPLAKSRPDLPVGLRLAVEKALEKDPTRRYQSARELVADLRAELRQAAGAASGLSPRPSRRAALVSGIALLAALALALVLFRKPHVFPANCDICPSHRLARSGVFPQPLPGRQNRRLSEPVRGTVGHLPAACRRRESAQSD